jgi:hypothetical protein
MAGVTFYGEGLAWIPGAKRCVAFVDGKYETDKVDEIAVLAPSYRHDGAIPEPDDVAPAAPKPRKAREVKHDG